MKLRVTDAGVVIPREMLPNVDEVDVRVDGNVIIVMPLRDPTDDAIWQMGSDPVTCGVPDASVNHDRYLYDSAPGESR